MFPERQICSRHVALKHIVSSCYFALERNITDGDMTYTWHGLKVVKSYLLMLWWKHALETYYDNCKSQGTYDPMIDLKKQLKLPQHVANRNHFLVLSPKWSGPASPDSPSGGSPGWILRQETGRVQGLVIERGNVGLIGRSFPVEVRFRGFAAWCLPDKPSSWLGLMESRG